MANPQRNDGAGVWHHVINQGARKLLIFADDSDRSSFLRYLSHSRDRYGLEIHAYCLMDNHFHLLAYSIDGRLSAAMQSIGSSYAQYFNQHHEFEGAVFRGRFLSKPLTSDDALLRVSSYIHLNPVKANLCTHPAEWPWSSYGAYSGVRDSPPWLETELTLSLAGGLLPFARLVNDTSVQEKSKPSQATSPLSTNSQMLLDDLDRRISTLTSTEISQIRMPRAGVANVGRSAAVLVASDSLGVPLDKVANHYGFNSIDSTSRAIRRAQLDQGLVELARLVTEYKLPGPQEV